MTQNAYQIPKSDKSPGPIDKYCPKMANIGTIGLQVNIADMPFTATGLTPDFTINPNCMKKYK